MNVYLFLVRHSRSGVKIPLVNVPMGDDIQRRISHPNKTKGSILFAPSRSAIQRNFHERRQRHFAHNDLAG